MPLPSVPAIAKIQFFEAESKFALRIFNISCSPSRVGKGGVPEGFRTDRNRFFDKCGTSREAGSAKMITFVENLIPT